LKSGSVEFKARAEKNPKNVELLPADAAPSMLAERVRALDPS
jgi:hypothetical protein